MLGAILLAAAAGYALWGVDLSLLRQANPWWVLGLAAGVVVNLLLTATLFWVITLSFDAQPQVPWWRMLQLISASAVVNYLPLGWPGPMARSAYLKAKHQMPVKQSVLVLLIVLGLTGVSAVLAVGLALGRERLVVSVGMGALQVILSIVNTPVMQTLLRRKLIAGWAWWPVKWLDMLVTAGRLWLAFGIVGWPISFIDALALAGVDMVISMVAITPSGLGASEWAVGLCSQWLAIAQGPVGVLAKLVDRTISVLVTLVLGLASARSLLPPDSPPPPGINTGTTP